jgi:hypothetical protein
MKGARPLLHRSREFESSLPGRIRYGSGFGFSGRMSIAKLETVHAIPIPIRKLNSEHNSCTGQALESGQNATAIV